MRICYTIYAAVPNLLDSVHARIELLQSTGSAKLHPHASKGAFYPRSLNRMNLLRLSSTAILDPYKPASSGDE